MDAASRSGNSDGEVLPNAPAVRDRQRDADELFNTVDALTDDAAEFFNDQDSQQN